MSAESGGHRTPHSALGTPHSSVDYLLVGHVCLDEGAVGAVREPPLLGGTVAYAALAAQGQGCRVGVVTSAAPDLDLAGSLPGIAVHVVSAAATTRFRNDYREGLRQQTLRARAALLTLDDVPDVWQAAPIVHLAPVAQEVDVDLARALRAPANFVGATPQGWLRGWDVDGVVVPQPCGDLPERLGAVDALVASEEDLAAEPAGAARLAAAGPSVAVTRGAAGVRLLQRGRVWELPACPARVCDPTGAGDVFAAVWFVHLAAGADARSAARHAACAAACAVERSGLAGVPTADQIEERLARWER